MFWVAQVCGGTLRQKHGDNAAIVIDCPRHEYAEDTLDDSGRRPCSVSRDLEELSAEDQSLTIHRLRCENCLDLSADLEGYEDEIAFVFRRRWRLPGP